MMLGLERLTSQFPFPLSWQKLSGVDVPKKPVTMHGSGAAGAGALKFAGTKMGGPTRQYMINTAKTQKITTPTNAYFLFITFGLPLSLTPRRESETINWRKSICPKSNRLAQEVCPRSHFLGKARWFGGAVVRWFGFAQKVRLPKNAGRCPKSPSTFAFFCIKTTKTARPWEAPPPYVASSP
jgi:hypothetical protein